MTDTISDSAQETAVSAPSRDQQKPKANDSFWSVRMANSYMKRQPILNDRWSYESGVVLRGIEQVWLDTGNKKYLEYIRYNVEQFVEPDGNIRTYNLKDYNLDQINPGKLLFQLNHETGDKRYLQALHLLMQQLKTQPRTSEGGFWHKKSCPYQMWLDGIYMAAPFYTQYADYFKEPSGFDDVAHQILLIERNTRDPKTGLYYHAWDESKIQKWANPQTGCSPHFWGRAMGWYAMAIVDVLDFLPLSHQARERIVTIFARMIQALMVVQDGKTGLWYQVLDRDVCEGNYYEALASCMFVYVLVKGIRKGYLTSNYLEAAQRGYAGIIKHFVEVDGYGQVNLKKNYQVAGLPGKEQLGSSYEQYIGEPIVTTDHKGVGAFILTSAEIERLSKPT